MHVTRLELRVRRQDTDEPEQRPSRAASSLLPPSSSSNSLFQVPRTVLSTLAAAVPRLELLKVKAVYGDVDLAEFGKQCPKLAELIMESEAIALQGIDLALPGLTTLDLIFPNVPWFLQELDRERAFVETACLLLRGCTKLSVVHIRFRSHMNSHHELECGKGVGAAPAEPRGVALQCQFQPHVGRDVVPWTRACPHLGDTPLPQPPRVPGTCSELRLPHAHQLEP